MGLTCIFNELSLLFRSGRIGLGHDADDPAEESDGPIVMASAAERRAGRCPQVDSPSSIGGQRHSRLQP
jgi:hypothetical protein